MPQRNRGGISGDRLCQEGPEGALRSDHVSGRLQRQSHFRDLVGTLCWREAIGIGEVLVVTL